MSTGTPRRIDDVDVLPHYTRSNERAQFLSDVITTAIEGGVNYWAEVEEYRWWAPDLDGGTAVHKEGQANAYAAVVDPQQERKRHLITVDDVARALGVCREGPVNGLSEKLRGDITANDRTNGDAPHPHQDIDADLADCIVQIAMFGEVIYG